VVSTERTGTDNGTVIFCYYGTDDRYHKRDEDEKEEGGVRNIRFFLIGRRNDRRSCTQLGFSRRTSHIDAAKVNHVWKLNRSRATANLTRALFEREVNKV